MKYVSNVFLLLFIQSFVLKINELKSRLLMPHMSVVYMKEYDILFNNLVIYMYIFILFFYRIILQLESSTCASEVSCWLSDMVYLWISRKWKQTLLMILTLHNYSYDVFFEFLEVSEVVVWEHAAIAESLLRYLNETRFIIIIKWNIKIINFCLF